MRVFKTKIRAIHNIEGKIAFISKISVKREHGILITVMRYFHFLKSVIRA